jgi:hypothetical protein
MVTFSEFGCAHDWAFGCEFVLQSSIQQIENDPLIKQKNWHKVLMLPVSMRV